MNRREGGFTLIELIIVMIVIVVLTVLGTAVLSGTQTQAEDSEREQDVKIISRALEDYYTAGNAHVGADTRGSYPSSTELAYILGVSGTYTGFTPTNPSSDGYVGEVLPGLSDEAMTPPTQTDPAFESGSSAVVNKYIYKPLTRGSNSICTAPGACNSYELYYIDSTNAPKTIKSKRK